MSPTEEALNQQLAAAAKMMLWNGMTLCQARKVFERALMREAIETERTIVRAASRLKCHRNRIYRAGGKRMKRQA